MKAFWTGLLAVAVWWTWIDRAYSQANSGDASTADEPLLPEVIVRPGQPMPTPDDPASSNNIAAAPNDNHFFDTPFGSQPVDGYAAPSVTTGMLGNTPLLDVPQSIGVVTDSLLHDQQLFSVGEAFRNVSGVQADHSAGNTTANGAEFNYLIRGFPTTYRRWNGYRSDLIQTSIDAGNIERIEFIKGPTSTLYGPSDAGGFLNIITKKPQAADFSRTGFSAGSWGLARTDVDVNRQLDRDVAFRVNVGLQQKDSFRAFANDDRILVAPVVAVRLTDRAQVILEGEYYSTNTFYDVGVMTINGSFNTLPVSRSLMDPTDFAFGDYYKAGVALQYDASDDWAAQLGYSFASTAQKVQSHFPFGRVGNDAVQIPVCQTNNGQLPTVLGSLVGRFETGPIVHHFATNFEFEWINTHTATEFFFGNAYLLDALNPVYAGTFPAAVNPGFRDTHLNGQIWSVQDRAELNDYVELLGGVSYQNFNRDYLAAGGGFPGATRDCVHAWTPRGSLLVHPVPDLLSTWYSYTESLLVQGFFFPDVNGNPIPPTAGRQHEIGVRLMPSDRWWASASVFDLNKSAVPQATPFGLTAPAHARSRGIEFDLYGALTERLNATVNYAYLDTRFTEDSINAGISGQQVPLVPHNSANAWLRYNLLDERLAGRRNSRRVLGFGNGLRWVSRSQTLSYPNFADFGGRSTLPGYVTWDLGLFGEFGRFFSNVYLENLTNVRYYTSGLGAFANPGNPTTVRITLGMTF